MFDIIIEGKISDLRKIWVESGKISDSDFNTLVEKDPTDQKKYLSWMCRIFANKQASIENLEKLVNKFESLVYRHRIGGEQANIEKYKTVKELEDFLATVPEQSKRQEKEQEKEKGANIYYSDENLVIIEPLSYEASKLYGKGTKWCISSEDNARFWWDYHKKGTKIVFFIFRKDKEKYAGVIYPNGEIEIRNSADNMVSKKDFIEKLKSKGYDPAYFGLDADKKSKSKIEVTENTDILETEDIKALYRKAGLPVPKGKGVHTKKFHELAVKIAKGYVERGDSPKEALKKAYPTAMKQLGAKKAVKKEHLKEETSESIIDENIDLDNLRIGFEYELKNNSDINEIHSIVLDNLKTDPDYYNKLVKESDDDFDIIAPKTKLKRKSDNKKFMVVSVQQADDGVYVVIEDDDNERKTIFYDDLKKDFVVESIEDYEDIEDIFEEDFGDINEAAEDEKYNITEEELELLAQAHEKGIIPDIWPSEEQMIDELSMLEDFVDPMDLSDISVHLAYLKYVLIPKAISYLKEKKEEQK